MPFAKYVDMARTPAEKAEEVVEMSLPTLPDYPWGLCIRLDEVDLEKLDIEDEDIEDGDTIHLNAMAVVKCVRSERVDGQRKVSIELELQRIAVEMPPENEEQPGDD